MSSICLWPLGSCPFRLVNGCLTCAIKTRAGLELSFNIWSAASTFSTPVPLDMRYRVRTVSQTAAELSCCPDIRSLSSTLVPSLTLAAVVGLGNDSADPVFCMFSIHALRCLSCANPSGEKVAHSYRSKKLPIRISCPRSAPTPLGIAFLDDSSTNPSRLRISAAMQSSDLAFGWPCPKVLRPC